MITSTLSVIELIFIVPTAIALAFVLWMSWDVAGDFRATRDPKISKLREQAGLTPVSDALKRLARKNLREELVRVYVMGSLLGFSVFLAFYPNASPFSPFYVGMAGVFISISVVKMGAAMAARSERRLTLFELEAQEKRDVAHHADDVQREQRDVIQAQKDATQVQKDVVQDQRDVVQDQRNVVQDQRNVVQDQKDVLQAEKDVKRSRERFNQGG
jgi:hypothetical protein